MKYGYWAIMALPLAAACSTDQAEIEPGEWEIRHTMTVMDVPGLPEDAVGEVQRGLGQTEIEMRCITEEEAADPLTTFTSPTFAENCEFERLTFERGIINIRGECQDRQRRGTSDVSLNGGYTSTTIEIERRVLTDSPVGQARIVGTQTGERVGACEG